MVDGLYDHGPVGVGDGCRHAENGCVEDAEACEDVRGGRAQKPVVAADILGGFDDGREDLPRDLDVLGLLGSFGGRLHE